MGAGASTKLADAPDPVPKDVAERTLGVTLDAAEWAARADADGRVSQARLLAESDKVARADEFFRDLGEFFRFRKDIDALWASQDGREALEAVEAVDKVKVDHRYEAIGQQVAPRTRAPVDSVAELYEAAEMARPAFEVVLRRCAGAGVLKVAPLKGQVRALEKARFDYAERPSPLSWLSDVVRGTIVCENASDAVAAYEALRATPGVQIVKLSNRYARPTPAGFRDLNVKFRLDPRAAAGNALGGSLSADAVDHVCECQVRIAGLDAFAAARDSHRFYEFFRHYFRGDWTQVEQQAATMRGLLEQGSSGGIRDAVRSLLADADTPPETLDALAGLCGDRLGLMEPAQQLYGRLAEDLATQHRSRKHTTVGVALAKQGFARQAVGAHGAAVDAFRQALAALSAAPLVYVDCAARGLGESLVGLGDYDGAEQTYEKALKTLKLLRHEAQSGLVLRARAALRSRRGHHDDALKDVAAAEASFAATAGPSSPEAVGCRVARAWVLLKYAEAERDAEHGEPAAAKFAEAADLADAASAELHRLVGLNSPAYGDAALVLARFRRLARERPVCERRPPSQAKVRLALGEGSPARAAAEAAVNALRRDHDVALARATHADALELLGKSGDAETERRRALDGLRGDADAPCGTLVTILLKEAAALEKRGDAAAAVAVASEAADVAARSTREPVRLVKALALRARLEDSLGRSDAAAATLEDALAAGVAFLGKPPAGGETLDERFGVAGSMLKRPPAEASLVGNLFYERGLLADQDRDYRRAVFFYDNALLLLARGRGEHAPFVMRLAKEVEVIRKKAPKKGKAAAMASSKSVPNLDKGGQRHSLGANAASTTQLHRHASARHTVAVNHEDDGAHPPHPPHGRRPSAPHEVPSYMRGKSLTRGH